MANWVMNALETAYHGLVFFAPHTQIKSDDALVVLIDAIQSDAALFGYVTSSLDRVDNLPVPREFEGKPVYERKVAVADLAEPHFPQATVEFLHSKGFEVVDFLEYLPAIIQFIQLFRKKRKD